MVIKKKPSKKRLSKKKLSKKKLTKKKPSKKKPSKKKPSKKKPSKKKPSKKKPSKKALISEIPLEPIEPISEIPFYKTFRGDPNMYAEKGIPQSIEHFMNSSHANHKDMDRLTLEGTSRIATAFEKAFTGALNKGPFEANDIEIYRYGAIIRPHAGHFDESSKNIILEKLKEIPDASVHIVDEVETFSLRINLGSAREGTNFMQASENIDYYKTILQDIYSYIELEYGDTEWFAFWDTEDAMYE